MPVKPLSEADLIAQRKCLKCQIPLKTDEEYLCDKCKDEAMKEDLAAQKLEEDDTDFSDAWRFKNSRGQSVFKRE